MKIYPPTRTLCIPSLGFAQADSDVYWAQSARDFAHEKGLEVSLVELVSNCKKPFFYKYLRQAALNDGDIPSEWYASSAAKDIDTACEENLTKLLEALRLNDAMDVDEGQAMNTQPSRDTIGKGMDGG